MAYRFYTPSEIAAIPIGPLREFAKEIGVKGPTNMSKEELDAAVYARLLEIEASRKVPSELTTPITRARVLNRMLVAEKDKTEFKPFTSKTHGVTTSFSGYFRCYDGNDGIISTRLYPQPTDIYVTQAFIDTLSLKDGDFIVGKYAVSPHSGLRMLVRVDEMNGKPTTTPRPMDFSRFTFKKPSENLEIVSKDNDLRAVDIVTGVKKGERILLTYDNDCSLTDLNMRLMSAMKGQGLDVQALFLGAMPESENEIESKGGNCCVFDVQEKYVRAAVGLLTDVARRHAEDDKDVVVIVDKLEECLDADLARALIGSAGQFENSSITVFAALNKSIINDKDYALLASGADTVIDFKKVDGKVVVNFGGCRVRSDKAESSVFACLKDMGVTALSKILENCPTRADVEKILG